MRGIDASFDGSKFRSSDVQWSEVSTQQLLDYFQGGHSGTELGAEYRAEHAEWLRGAIAEIKQRIANLEDEQNKRGNFLALSSEEQDQTSLSERPLRQEFIEESLVSLRTALRNAELELANL